MLVCDIKLKAALASSNPDTDRIIDPNVMKISAATMRKIASIRAGQGGGAGSKIDMPEIIFEDG
jgi:hypothetical protein